MFNNFTDEQSTYENCNVILPAGGGNGALLIGDFNSVTDTLKIQQHKIKTIITAAMGMDHLQISPNVQHITYPLLDANSENIRRFFDQSTQTIQNSLKSGGVLVHCAAGISRSATLVIAYIMKTQNLTFRQAISLVRERRNVRPNLGFQRQLKQYEKQLAEIKENRFVLKKTITDTIGQERRTSYNRSSHLSKMFNDYLKFQPEPRTADESVRRKNEYVKRGMFPQSQSRPRDRKKFVVRPLGKQKQSFFVLGLGHGVKDNISKQSIGYSQQIKPPLIQNHHRNALNNAWVRLPPRK